MKSSSRLRGAPGMEFPSSIMVKSQAGTQSAEYRLLSHSLVRRLRGEQGLKIHSHSTTASALELPIPASRGDTNRWNGIRSSAGSIRAETGKEGLKANEGTCNHAGDALLYAQPDALVKRFFARSGFES